MGAWRLEKAGNLGKAMLCSELTDATALTFGPACGESRPKRAKFSNWDPGEPKEQRRVVVSG